MLICACRVTWVTRAEVCIDQRDQDFFLGGCCCKANIPQVLLKSGGQSPAPWVPQIYQHPVSVNFSQALKLRSNRPPISPQRSGLPVKLPAFGDGLDLQKLAPGENMVLTLHRWRQRASRGRTMTRSGGKGAQGIHVYRYIRSNYVVSNTI